MEFLGKDNSPLTQEEWEILEKAIWDVAKRTLICRRFMPVVGPLGAGLQMVSYDVFLGVEPGSCEVSPGEEAQICEPVRVGKRKNIPLPTIYKPFAISWRDLEYFRQLQLPIDTSAASAAAFATAVAEDTLIIHGNERLGIEGLLTVEGRQSMSMSDWDVMGNAFNDVSLGISKLSESGFFGPYYLLLNPKEYFKLNRVYHNTGLLELEQIKKLVADVFYTPIVPEGKAILVSAGPQNMDIALAMDISLAYVETTNMIHHFRVMEILAPRIKRPGAILVIGK
ncbi:Linocin_M18 bacteriocin protein [Thermocrinis albus DSM 14484]|uniref:Linocin_M18 bacteriocin protein n=1 Tax=Thermocrinis albus (strain DSM 14484 / JCM 11386 / HI 11/12) TaxID=638303 RepID=D3SL86_THEAH|nr:family 1 encapsulin nanocompartment shell protein [Thermocrinis albus]ADC89516.1 Linocin_M18 bacteriocin protein [Thermocrinis albus DSM 14484]